MTPPTPKRRPQTPNRAIRIQPNPAFENEDEMHNWVNANIPGARIVRTWIVEKIRCEVELPPKSNIEPIKKKKNNTDTEIEQKYKDAMGGVR